MQLSLPTHTPQTLRRIAALVAAGTALGLVYNASNPVGLSWSAPAGTPAAAPGANARPPATAVITPASGPHRSVSGSYENTRLSFVAATGAASPVPAASPYANQTISVRPGTASPSPPAPAPAAANGLRATTWAAVQAEVAAGRLTLVDSRPSATFNTGHIPGAVSLPFAQFNSHIAAFKKSHPPQTPLVIYCGNARCVISKSLANELITAHAYTDVRYIPGGYLEWVASQAN